MRCRLKPIEYFGFVTKQVIVLVEGESKRAIPAGSIGLIDVETDELSFVDKATLDAKFEVLPPEPKEPAKAKRQYHRRAVPQEPPKPAPLKFPATPREDLSRIDAVRLALEDGPKTNAEILAFARKLVTEIDSQGVAVCLSGMKKLTPVQARKRDSDGKWEITEAGRRAIKGAA